MYRKYIKRLIDILFSLFGIIILSPLLLIICLFIKSNSRGPVMFKQKRVGVNNSYFYMLKFRTMRIDTPHDVPTHLLKNPEQWITNVGKILRKTSLDELPQLFNILSAKMSFIGPRPALWNQYDLLYERDKYGVNNIRPGLSGWAQINGRDELSIEDKAKLDGEYLINLNFLFDCKCLFGTITTVFKRTGVAEGGVIITSHMNVINNSHQKVN